MLKHSIAAGFALCASAGIALAGGFFADIVRVVPVVGQPVGDAMDNTHRKIKETIRPYGQAEEAASGVVRKGFSEIGGEVGGPILAEWIRASQRNVLNAGTAPIPPQILQAVRGFFPDHVLSKVRYRSGWGHELALPANAFRFHQDAITLGTVIMFRSESDAQTNDHLWAHELSHVLQYERWGINDFAKRYVKDSGSVERDAESNAQRYLAWRQQRNNTFAANPSASRMARSCMTYAGYCALPAFGPVGAPCWCASVVGPINGQIGP